MSLVPVPSQCCHYCGGPDTLNDWAKAFDVQICRQCRRQEQLISKSNAKAQFLLSDSDLAKLGYLERPNTHHKDFAAMKMFLLSQVEQLAVVKHGSLEELTEEKQRRVKDKIEAKARRRQREELLQEKQQQHQQALQAALDKYTDNARQHQQQHEELEEVITDPVTNKRYKRVNPECAAAEVEEI